MSDPSLAIQNAIEATLRADSATKALFGGTTRLYTLSAPLDAQGKAKFPHIVIGQDQVLGDDTECGSSSEVAVTVHVYACEDTPTLSRSKAKQIAGAVRAALTTELTLEDHVMDDWIFDSIEHLTDPDGLTSHSVVRLTYLTTASA